MFESSKVGVGEVKNGIILAVVEIQVVYQVKSDA